MKHFLRLCAEIEKTVEKVYQLFAEKTDADPELKELWSTLANDEQDHTRQLELAERISAGETFPGQQIAIERVQDLLAEVRAVLASAQEAMPEPLEALKTSILLEKRFMDIHVTNAVYFPNESLRNTFAALGRSDEAHFNSIKAFLRLHYDDFFDPS